MVYSGPAELRIEDVPEPVAGQDDVIVSVQAVGICGSELEGFASGSPFRKPPLIMGHEFAGVREDTGERVVVNPLVACGRCDACQRGQGNICRNRTIVGIQRAGAFAERVAVPERNCHVLPEGMAFEAGALVEPLANAVHAFRLAQRDEPPPRRIGVIGAGTLGLMTAYVARRRGVAEIEIADISELRRTVAGEAGFDAVERLSGEFDLVFDAVGSARTRADSVELLRPGGASIWIGLHGADAGFDGFDLIRNEKRVLATFCYTDGDFREAIGLADALDREWVRSTPLEDGVGAFYELLRGPTPSVKTMLVP
jgi:threonine dehydrogenase-like Zn-dependent dehydrogenase